MALFGSKKEAEATKYISEGVEAAKKAWVPFAVAF
jgi:hypothetical protein